MEFDTVINTETFYYIVVKDITDLYCEKGVPDISLIDDLSGLYNKRFLITIISQIKALLFLMI